MCSSIFDGCRRSGVSDRRQTQQRQKEPSEARRRRQAIDAVPIIAGNRLGAGGDSPSPPIRVGGGASRSPTLLEPRRLALTLNRRSLRGPEGSMRQRRAHARVDIAAVRNQYGRDPIRGGSRQPATPTPSGTATVRSGDGMRASRRSRSRCWASATPGGPPGLERACSGRAAGYTFIEDLRTTIADLAWRSDAGHRTSQARDDADRRTNSRTPPTCRLPRSAGYPPDLRRRWLSVSAANDDQAAS